MKKKNKHTIKITKFLYPLVIFAAIILTTSVMLGSTLKKSNNHQAIISSSPTPIFHFKEATFDKKTRKLTSPLVQDGRAEEKYSFTLPIPEGWEITRNEFRSEGIKNIEFRKNNYLFAIGGSVQDRGEVCNFAVNGDTKPLEELERIEGEIGEILDQYSLIKSKLGDIRFGRINAKYYKEFNYINFISCQLDERFNTPTWTEGTKIGLISLRTPYYYDQKIVDEAKAIISNIEFKTYHQSHEEQPSIYPDRLVSPTIMQGNDKYILTIHFPSTWKVTTSEFYYLSTEYSEGIYSYFINLESNDSSYKIRIIQGESSPSYCLFPPYNEDETNLPSLVKCDTYQSLQANIGELRMIGPIEYKEDKKITFAFAQMIPENNPKQWMLDTRIGRIGFELPEQYNKKTFEEMKNILMNIKLQEQVN